MVASRLFLPIHPGRFPDGKLVAPLKPSFHSLTAKLALCSSPQQRERTEDSSHLERRQLHHNEKASSGFLDALLHSPVRHQVSLPPVAKALTLTSNRNGLLSYSALWVACMWVTCKNNNLTLSSVQLQEVLLCKPLNNRDLCIQYIQTTSQRPNVITQRKPPTYRLLIDGPKADFSSCCRRGSITMRKRIGDRTDPWRMPLITGNSLDLCPFNLTQPLKPQYQSFSSLHNFPLIPMPYNRCKRIGYLIESNAFSRSYRHMYTLLPPCMYCAIVSCVAKIASAQEISLRYADWLTCGSSASSKNSCSRSTMRNSRTFTSVDVKVTPRKLSIDILSTTLIHWHQNPCLQDTWHSLRLHNKV